MYKRFIRPLLFLLSPEKIHDLVVSVILFLYRIPGFSRLIRTIYRPSKRKETQLMGLTFPGKVGLAAGFDKNALFYREFADFGFSFIEIGTVTPLAQPGNHKPRSFRLPKDKALINRMGFNNLGVDSAVERLKNRPQNLVIGGNIGKNTLTPNSEAVNDYSYCFRKLYDYVDYFVINVSCPNISDLRELQDQDMLEGILRELADIRANESVYRPILLKISPDLNYKQLDESLALVNQYGIDGIVATNTSIKRDNLNTPKQKVISAGQGGLSGAPIRDISDEIIRYIRKKAGNELPVIGVGGIMTPEDALKKINAGADLVQIYTGFIYEGPGIVNRIEKALEE